MNLNWEPTQQSQMDNPHLHDVHQRVHYQGVGGLGWWFGLAGWWLVAGSMFHGCSTLNGRRGRHRLAPHPCAVRYGAATRPTSTHGKRANGRFLCSSQSNSHRGEERLPRRHRPRQPELQRVHLDRGGRDLPRALRTPEESGGGGRSGPCFGRTFPAHVRFLGTNMVAFLLFSF